MPINYSAAWITSAELDSLYFNNTPCEECPSVLPDSVFLKAYTVYNSCHCLHLFAHISFGAYCFLLGVILLMYCT